jgi:hypothetical protein
LLCVTATFSASPAKNGFCQGRIGPKQREKPSKAVRQSNLDAEKQTVARRETVSDSEPEWRSRHRNRDGFAYLRVRADPNCRNFVEAASGSDGYWTGPIATFLLFEEFSAPPGRSHGDGVRLFSF